MQPALPVAEKDRRIILGFSAFGAVIASVVAVFAGSAAFGEEVMTVRLSAEESRFVQNQIYCRHLIGGSDYIESVSPAYGKSLELALAGAQSKADVHEVFVRLHRACSESVAIEAEKMKLAVKTD